MRRALKLIGQGLLFTIVALALAIVVVPKFLDRVYYVGPASGHFNGTRFFNPDGEDDAVASATSGRRNIFVNYLLAERPPWPERVEVEQSKPQSRVNGDRMVVTWVGHATFLVQTQGLNILTDPVWASSVGPLGVGPSRVAAPGIAFKDLPKIDVVIISHNHYDHMDLDTIGRLWRRDQPKIVTSLGNDAVIAESGAQAVARDWGERVAIKPGVDIVVTRNHHWGSRWGVDRNRALWSSFVVTLPGGNLFFGGDTGMGDGEWPREAAAYGPVRLALIPIGAFRFRPGQMSVGSHIGPIDSAEVFDRLGATRGIGMHWGTFRLSYEAYDTPPKLLAEVMKCRGQTGFDTATLGRPIEIEGYRQRGERVAPGLAKCLESEAVTRLP